MRELVIRFLNHGISRREFVPPVTERLLPFHPLHPSGANFK